MGHKINPIGLRIGINKTWQSKWFANGKKYRDYFLEDIKLKKFIKNKLKNAGVARCEIERDPQAVKINIYSSRPGVIIGRSGVGVEELRKEAKRMIASKKAKVEINIKEIKKPEENAALVAQNVAEQIEKRMSYRKVMKKTMERSFQSGNVEGIKVMVAGRLNGVDIARKEWLSSGKIPLHTLRANVDFAKYKAHTTYGVIGVKVWLYKGEVFNKKKDKQNKDK